MTESEVSNLIIIIASPILSQISYAFLVLILGSIIVEYYEWGVFRPAETKFQKFTNFIMKGMFGAGFYFYHKYSKHNWLTAKILYTITFIGMCFVALIGFNIVRIVVMFVFNQMSVN
ncbi:hypothetical protein [Alkalihalophilus marmarensis]|uniref:hypothetical protein n=1 Tax=Alkalihalophilus marmarensis TaxID=521377 RepID=UPI002DBC3348|nr:hypothetical protein [Alkalihalophilus marmarensis]MEC2072296.1 hypothetical protein [Alkalihalophilus marmarensis]